MKKILVLVILSIQYCYGYDFSQKLPNEDVLIDLDFNYGDNHRSLEEMVAADIMYVIASESFLDSPSVQIEPFVISYMRKNRPFSPYHFRILKVGKSDKATFYTFWKKLKELSRWGASKVDINKAKESLEEMISKVGRARQRTREFLEQYNITLKRMSSERVNSLFHQRFAPLKADIRYTISPVSLASLSIFEDHSIHLASSVQGFVLDVADEDKGRIYEIIHTMGTHGLFSLLKKKSHLQGLGKQINHVPPLQFLGYIVTDPVLKEDLKTISKSHFKWSNFVEGLSTTLNRDWKSGKIKPQLAHFATFVGKDLVKLQSSLEKQNIEDFVKSLL